MIEGRTVGELLYPDWQTRDRCACNRAILSEPYYGLQLGGDHDPDTIVYFDADHPHCLAEWGLTLYGGDPLGVRHCTGTEETGEEDIRAS